jgi:hypothetical protein
MQFSPLWQHVNQYLNYCRLDFSYTWTSVALQENPLYFSDAMVSKSPFLCVRVPELQRLDSEGGWSASKTKVLAIHAKQ